MIWAAVIGGTLGCYLLKLSGWAIPQSVIDHPWIRRVTEVLPLALLGALVAVQTFASGQSLVIDGRLVGLAVAALALLLRAPFIVVVLAAAVAAAVLRAAGWVT